MTTATETETPISDPAERARLAAKWTPDPVMATTYSFPSMEPVRFVNYHRDHLHVPLRRDILHRAIVYEGDITRQGTASTKWRSEVHGGNRKLYSQKGLGMARAGDKKSPVRRGGGVAFGPHPRDFSTDLPRKIYDKAWRIALSYRYKRGQLIIIDEDIAIPQDATPYLIKNIFRANQWGQSCGRSTLITESLDKHLFSTVQKVGKHAKILHLEDVDVKDLLETGRLIIEKKSLDKILRSHSKDISMKAAVAKYD